MTPEDSLAALRDGGKYEPAKVDRPIRRRLDSDGAALTVEVPGPRPMARAYLLPVLDAAGKETFRTRDGMAWRAAGSNEPPAPLDTAALARRLQAKLAALPPRDDAGRPYRDLRLLSAASDPAFVLQYAASVVASARRLLPEYRPPRAARPVREGPPPTAAEARAASRERARQREEASARYWLGAFLDERASEPEWQVPRIRAAVLYELAADDLADLAEDKALIDEDDPAAGRVNVPGPRVFYAVADDLLGPRYRYNGERYYRLPSL